METKKDSLEVQVMILEGEKKDFEAKILELESRESATCQEMGEFRTRVGELVTQNKSLEAHLKVENET